MSRTKLKERLLDLADRAKLHSDIDAEIRALSLLTDLIKQEHETK